MARMSPELLEVLRAELPKRFPQLSFFFQPADIVNQILNFGLPAPVDIQIAGYNPKLYGIAREIEGKIRAIAVTTAKRSSAAPEIPTIAESIPGFEATTWFALFAPAGTPKPVIDRLNAETVRIFKLPDIQERLQKLGLEPVLSTPEELTRYQATEIVKWTKVVKESGASAD